MESKKPNVQILEELHKAIQVGTTNFVKVGKEYGVSDNAVRKWFKSEGFEKITKSLKGGLFECHHCGKEFLKREGGHLQKNQEKEYYNYCTRSCAQEHKSLRGIKGSLTQEKYTELKSTMSIRAISRMYNCSHTTLLANFE